MAVPPDGGADLGAWLAHAPSNRQANNGRERNWVMGWRSGLKIESGDNR